MSGRTTSEQECCTSTSQSSRATCMCCEAHPLEIHGKNCSVFRTLDITVFRSLGRQSVSTTCLACSAPAVNPGRPSPQPTSSTEHDKISSSCMVSQHASSSAQGHTRQPVPPAPQSHSCTHTLIGSVCVMVDVPSLSCRAWRKTKLHTTGLRCFALHGKK